MTLKQNATAKVDSIIAENPGVSLDDLVNDRKINADQKAQAMKKPQLQANLAQLEEQVAQYKKVDQGYQKRLRSEKEALRAAHKTELENVRAEVKQETRAEAEKEAHQNVLVLSKFLRLAAARRHDMDSDPESAERKALEGLLLMVYGGDDAAVEATQKLVTGSDERILSTASEPVDYTCPSSLAPLLACGSSRRRANRLSLQTRRSSKRPSGPKNPSKRSKKARRTSRSRFRLRQRPRTKLSTLPRPTLPLPTPA